MILPDQSLREFREIGVQNFQASPLELLESVIDGYIGRMKA